jgi:hypothetical protein
MSPSHSMDKPPGPDSPGHLGQMAVFVAAGTVIGTRARMGGALVMAGLAWLAMSRRRQTEGLQTIPQSPPTACPLLPTLDTETFCPPSNPFLDDEPAEAMTMEDLRAALLPPPSLFTPPASHLSTSVPGFTESPLLKSAPVYIEVADDAVSTPVAAVEKSVLPDTIVIPTNPEPPSNLWSNSPSSHLNPITPPPPAPPLIPLADLPKLQNPAGSVTPRGAEQPPVSTQKERGFLAWMRRP